MKIRLAISKKKCKVIAFTRKKTVKAITSDTELKSALRKIIKNRLNAKDSRQ